MIFASLVHAGVARSMDGKTFSGDVSFVDGPAVKIVKDSVPVDRLLDVELRPPGELSRGIVLADGRMIAGKIEGIDEQAVRFTPTGGGTKSVPTANVARVVFKPVDATKVPADSVGLLLVGGDFFDGTVQAFSDRSITMASAAFGATDFDLAAKAAAVVYRRASRADGPWVIRATDGSVFTADHWAVAGGAVEITDPTFGVVRIEPSRLASIRSGRPRAAQLIADGTDVDVLGGRFERAVIVHDPPATIDIPAGYTRLSLRAAVPRHVLPTAAVRLVVRLDDKEALRSDPVTSIDDPVVVTVPIGSAKRVTFAVEPAGKDHVGVVGVFGDAVLLGKGQ